MAKLDFAGRDPILCNLSIIDQVFLPQDRTQKLHKIGSLPKNLVRPFNFFWNFALETMIRMSKFSVIWEFKFQYWQKSPATKQADWTHCGLADPPRNNGRNWHILYVNNVIVVICRNLLKVAEITFLENFKTMRYLDLAR